MKKVAFCTLGCKVNQYETEALTELFIKHGYKIVNFDDEANVYIINTCTVTNLSDRKSRQMIRRATKKNNEAIVAVIGCYSQMSSKTVENIEGVDIVIGTKDKGRIIDEIEKIKKHKIALNLVENIGNNKVFEELKIQFPQNRTRAFVKIQDGCNQYCSYCIIPYARGPIRSRKIENIVDEVKTLSNNGFKEIVLTGIHLASFGKDQNNVTLSDLIEKVHNIEGVERIRLGSIDPQLITEEFIESTLKLPKMCLHYHISIQSGCNETLKRMNRKYTVEECKKKIELLRNKIPDVSISTDIIVGFPGETNLEFTQTFDFLKDIKLSKIHVFKYSKRDGTAAAKFENQIAPEQAEKRSKILLQLSDDCSKDFNMKFIGRTMPVLFEQLLHNNSKYMEGLTSSHIRVICPYIPNTLGEIENVLIDKADSEGVYGVICK